MGSSRVVTFKSSSFDVASLAVQFSRRHVVNTDLQIASFNTFLSEDFFKLLQESNSDSLSPMLDSDIYCVDVADSCFVALVG